MIDSCFIATCSWHWTTQEHPLVISLGYLLIDGFALMSYAPVIEPFRAANLLAGETHYRWRHFSVSGDAALASNGVSLSVDGPVTSMGKLDILFVCAGGNPALFWDTRTFEALRRAARFGARLAGVSGGPFILARAGLLDGYRCTIHWEHESAFAETFAAPRLETGLFVIDRDRITCAGGIAGLELATALIASSHGEDLARSVSDWYIQPQQRQPTVPQRASIEQRYRVSHTGLIRALAAIDGESDGVLGRSVLATIAGTSVRQLERLFSSQLGTTICAHHTRVRLERARRLLSETALSIGKTSEATGFSSASQFSKAFKAQYLISPSLFRARCNGTTIIDPVVH
jgi:transcriptional regulator GlxA family with amidase domain